MLSRRCRIQARPNIKPNAAGNKCLTKERLSTEISHSLSLTKSPERSPIKPIVSSEAVDIAVSSNSSDIIGSNDKSSSAQEGSKFFNGGINEDNVTAETTDGKIQAVSDRSSSVTEDKLDCSGFSANQDIVTRERNISTSSSLITRRSSSPFQYPPLKRRPRKKFTGEEPLDPKKMTMHDLISWNPKNDTMMKYHIGKRSRKSSTATTVTDVNAADKNVFKKEENSAIPAPKVRIAEDGTLVLDESSLTVAQEKLTNIWETVDEDRVVRKISSLSFRKSAVRKSLPWTSLETDLFYVILRATGPDFGLMHEFFPSRSRSELKSKFNKEERTNWDRLKHSLSTPTLLDDSLYNEANRLLKKINEEALRKKEKVQSFKRNKVNNDDANISWDEDEADLIAEAEEEIQRIENENREEYEDDSIRKVNAVRKSSQPIKKMKAEIMDETSKEAKRIITNNMRRKYDAEAKQLQGAVIAGLSPSFPNFIVEYIDEANAVTIQLNDDRIPVVKVPLDTVVRVLPEDDKQPERVLFECIGETEVDVKRYIIKHQSGPGKKSSGFLNLFGAVS